MLITEVMTRDQSYNTSFMHKRALSFPKEKVLFARCGITLIIDHSLIR